VHAVAGFSDLVGYRMLGREGELGRVVDCEEFDGAPETAALVVRGGVSDALLYHIPSMRLIGVSHETRTVSADVDVADFVPSFGEGGIVELRLD
jgi:hypothetical protein